MAVREKAGLFDVGHMGEFVVKDSSSLNFLQRVTTNDVSKLVVGGCQYSTVTNELGGTKDDIMVYRTEKDEFMVVCNASNVEKIGKWFDQQKIPGVEIEDITMTTTLFALQGPMAQSILQKLTDFDLTQIKRFKNVFLEVAGIKILVSRTGYTGEDGFEIYLMDEPASEPKRAEKLWDVILKAGDDSGVKPCGLGARDTTRLEAGMCLYGNELTEDITPLEAKINFAVKLEKGDFIGRDALTAQKNSGLKKVRIGLRMLESGVPRQGHKIFRDGVKIGAVTSGTFSPILKVGIAMAYVSPDVKLDDKISVEIREKKYESLVVGWPFYDSNVYGSLRNG